MSTASTADSDPASSVASAPRPPNGSRRSLSHWPVSYGAIGLIGRARSITVAVTGRIREEDLDPAAREDLMDLYRRWQRDRDR
jgi:hypothetical protein